MLTERIQFLVTPQQRHRLASEASRRDMSVAAVVREAIDSHLPSAARHSHLPSASRKERLRAFEAIVSAQGGRYLTPDEINGLVEEERDAAIERTPPGPG